jgi:protein involved in polysaccharide export with SLBB domain
MHSTVSHSPRLLRLLVLLAVVLLSGVGGGCASFSNPVADGVPVHRLPPEVLGKPREELRTIPMTWLRQKPPDVYRLAPGDILGVFVGPGVFGDQVTPPVQIPEPGSNLPPAIGFPIPVREDGTITLPLIPPLKVEGKSIAEVQQDLVTAYTKTKEIIKPDVARVIVTVLKKRQYTVLVVRQDSGALTVGQGGAIGQTKRGTGYVLSLPAGENDVLNALNRSGGLPGLDAENEVVIQRGYFQNFDNKDAVLHHVDQCQLRGGQFVRIPLKLRPDEQPPFKPEDVILQNGDIIFIEARDTELFYTGGLLPPRQFILPRDYDLDVVQAVAFAAGPLINGGIGLNNQNGNIVSSGLGSPSPSLVTILRRTPGGGQIPIRVSLNDALRDPRQRVLIQAGDFIILQETLDESLTRYVTTVLRFNFLGTIIRQQDLLGTANANLP